MTRPPFVEADLVRKWPMSFIDLITTLFFRFYKTVSDMIKDQADSQVFDESVDEYDSIEVWDNSWTNLRHSSIIMIFKTSLKFFILRNLLYHSFKCIEKVEIQAKAYFKLFLGKKLENNTRYFIEDESCNRTFLIIHGNPLWITFYCSESMLNIYVYADRVVCDYSTCISRRFHC